MAARRAGWHEQLAASSVAALVFVDESGANTKITRLRGRALGGQRLLARIPHGHYHTSTLISGVRLGGPCSPWLFDGAMNGEMFWAWVQQGLAPTLPPGDVVILDNLSTQRSGVCARPWKPPVPAYSICHLIRRTSTRSDRCGARPNRSCAAMLRAAKRNCCRRPRPPLTPFLPPTAKASFLVPSTIHNKWKYSRLKVRLDP